LGVTARRVRTLAVIAATVLVAMAVTLSFVQLNQRRRPPRVLKVLVEQSSRVAPAAQRPRQSPPWSPSTPETGRETSSA
jgi:hypothetical protein